MTPVSPPRLCLSRLWVKMWDWIWSKPKTATHSIRYEIRWQSLGSRRSELGLCAAGIRNAAIRLSRYCLAIHR